jgi:hypothetical protein
LRRLAPVAAALRFKVKFAPDFSDDTFGDTDVRVRDVKAVLFDVVQAFAGI